MLGSFDRGFAGVLYRGIFIAWFLEDDYIAFYTIFYGFAGFDHQGTQSIIIGLNYTSPKGKGFFIGFTDAGFKAGL